MSDSGARIARLQHALRGVQLIAAITLVAEIQDFHRFANPRQLMAYLGLVPSEDSSGQRRRQGAITKAGNSAARRMLVEVAHPVPPSGSSQCGHRQAPVGTAQGGDGHCLDCAVAAVHALQAAGRAAPAA